MAHRPASITDSYAERSVSSSMPADRAGCHGVEGGVELIVMIADDESWTEAPGWRVAQLLCRALRTGLARHAEVDDTTDARLTALGTAQVLMRYGCVTEARMLLARWNVLDGEAAGCPGSHPVRTASKPSRE